MSEMSKEQKEFLEDLERSKKESGRRWERFDERMEESEKEVELIVLQNKNDIEINSINNNLKAIDTDIQFIFILFILINIWVIFSLWGL